MMRRIFELQRLPNLSTCALTLCLFACFDPNRAENPNCSVNGECPSGLICQADNVCRSSNDGGSTADAAAPLARTKLIDLRISLASPLVPEFAPSQSSYIVDASILAGEIRITPVAMDPNANILVDGQAVESGQLSAPISIAVGMNSIVIQLSVDGESESYSLEVNRGSGIIKHSLYAKAPLAENSLNFGTAIAVDGDTFVVGVPEEDGDGVGINPKRGIGQRKKSGAIFVFRRIDGQWRQEAYIKASNTGREDEFGTSVAISGNLIAVGAARESGGSFGVDGDPNDGDDSRKSGAVYLFRRGGAGEWSQTAYIKASNTGANDRFGISVSLSENRLAVGAMREDSPGRGIDDVQTDSTTSSNSGAVYIFGQSNGQWAQEAYIKASNTGSGHEFGATVALSGDTLAVGAPSETSNATGVNGTQTGSLSFDSGAVYVFRTSPVGDWQQEAYIKAFDAQIGDEFGSSVALSGDTLAVGAPLEDSGSIGVHLGNGGPAASQSGGSSSGVVYVFGRTAGVWTQDAYIKPSNTGIGDGFGRALSLSDTILGVGSALEDSSAILIDGDEGDLQGTLNSGAAYVFSRSNMVWSQTAYVKASNTGLNDGFGSSIAVSSDFLVVGARNEDSNATGLNGDEENDLSPGSGAVYLFE